MSVEIIREEIAFTKELCSSNIQAIVDSDIIVPDSKPDVKRILEVSAIQHINEKNISHDYINVTGIVIFNILYVSDDENNGINRIEYSSPFTKQIPAVGICEDSICIVKSDAVHTESSIYNSRKINIKCAIDICASVFENNVTNVVTEVSDERILPSVTKAANLHDVCFFTDNIFHVGEMCYVEDGTTISDILKYKISVVDPTVKMVANKAVVKGNLCATVFYLSDGDLKEFSQEIPFTQIIDATDFESDMDVGSQFCVKNIVVDKELDTDATMSKLNVQADVEVGLTFSREKQLQYISDIYSPDFNISVNSETIKVNSLYDRISSQYIVNDTVSVTDDSMIEKVLSLDTKAYIEQSDVKNNNIEIKGCINTSLIYMSSENEILSEYKQIPFETSVPVSGNVDNGIRCVCEIESQSPGYNIDGNTKVNIRDVIKFKCEMISERNINVIEAVEVDEDDKVDKSNQAGITVYFIQSNDSMWDIAKRYNTTEAEIKEVNRLEQDYVPQPGQQLLIPKHN